MGKLSINVAALPIALLLLLSCPLVSAQDISGTWSGSLEVMNAKLRLVFHIEKNQETYTTKMDSPDQGALGIAVATTLFDGQALRLELPTIGATYDGTLQADSMFVGTFSQMGQGFPLRLTKSSIASTGLHRPQEPKPPFPYRSEEVSFVNKQAGITLAGTLTLPENGSSFPAAILISGSGPQNRDEEIFGHKPFLVIADFLTRKGMAVLRYDDRGIGKSTGDFNRATSADFATDATAAFDFLQTRTEINKRKIGMIGHSEGGMIAPIVASQRPETAFIIFLAAPGIPIDSLMILQNEAILYGNGASPMQVSQASAINRKAYQLVKDEHPGWKESLTHLLSGVFDNPGSGISEEQSKAAVEQQLQFFDSPWMRYFLKFDPAPYLRDIKCPVLALNGSKDVQVTAKENLNGIREALRTANNQHVVIKELPGLNHLFQESTTGLVTEYGSLEQTFAPSALKELSDWLTQQGFLIESN